MPARLTRNLNTPSPFWAPSNPAPDFDGGPRSGGDEPLQKQHRIGPCLALDPGHRISNGISSSHAARKPCFDYDAAKLPVLCGPELFFPPSSRGNTHCTTNRETRPFPVCARSHQMAHVFSSAQTIIVEKRIGPAQLTIKAALFAWTSARPRRHGACAPRFCRKLPTVLAGPNNPRGIPGSIFMALNTCTFSF